MLKSAAAQLFSGSFSAAINKIFSTEVSCLNARAWLDKSKRMSVVFVLKWWTLGIICAWRTASSSDALFPRGDRIKIVRQRSQGLLKNGDCKKKKKKRLWSCSGCAVKSTETTYWPAIYVTFSFFVLVDKWLHWKHHSIMMSLMAFPQTHTSCKRMEHE